MLDKIENVRLKRAITLLVLSMGLAIIVIDSSVLNVSISQIIKDLDTDIESIQWVISAYSLVLGALTITGGRLGDLYGRKRMFVLGAVIFAIGSLIASFSQSITTLLIGWSIVEGIGAALMMPATASLLISTFQGRARAMAFGIWGGVAAAASAFCPLVGGYLTTNASWHWAFRINVFVVAVLLFGSTIIKESRDTKEKKDLDQAGVLLSSVALFLIVFGIIKSSTYGWIKAKKDFEIFGQSFHLFGLSITPIAIIVGLVFLGFFAYWQYLKEKRNQTPLVSLRLFMNKQFDSGLITTLVLSLGQAGLVFSIPIFLQAVTKLNAFQTGVAMLPMSISLLFAAPFSAAMSKKITPKILIFIGLTINLVAVFVLHSEINVDAKGVDLIPGLLLYGIGMGFVMSQINNITLSAVHTYQAGEASGVNATVRQIGSSLGSAIIGAIFLSTFTTNLSTGIKDSKVIPSAAKTQIVEQVETAGSNLEFGGSVNQSQDMPEVMTTEITSLAKKSTVKGNKSALVLTGSFIFMSMGVAALLPNTKNLEAGQKQSTNAVH